MTSLATPTLNRFAALFVAALLLVCAGIAPAQADGTDDSTPLVVRAAHSEAPMVLNTRASVAPAAPLACVECGFGADDANKVSSLTLTYTGAGGFVEIYDNADQSASKRLFQGTLATNAVITITAASIGEDSFSSKIGFWVGGLYVAEIHTSCSDAVGPGTTEQTQSKGKDPNGVADFRVEAGTDKDGVDLCSITPPLNTCKECGFGADDADKVSSLTLTYTGAGGLVEVYDNADQKPDNLLYSMTLSTGDVFTINASTIGNDSFSSKVGFWVGGLYVAELHTSCSDTVGPGTTEQTQSKGKDPNGVADVRVESGLDKDNVALCAPPPPPPCRACDGGVTMLSLVYLGTTTLNNVVVYNDKDDKPADILLSVATLNNADLLTFQKPVGDDKLSGDVSVWANGNKLINIHTSCSQPIGPNATFGDFTVVESSSTKNGKICPVPPCGECKGGVTRVTFRYNGPSGVDLTFYNDKDDKDPIQTFTGVQDGDELPITAASIGEDKFNDFSVWSGGNKLAEFHASCSAPIGPGATEGTSKHKDFDPASTFTVVTSSSKDNGAICPDSACGDCSGGVTSMTFRYNGPNGNTVTFYNDSDDKDPIQTFTNVQDGDELPITAALIGEDKFNKELSVWSGGNKLAEFHLSCSTPIGPGISEATPGTKHEDFDAATSFTVVSAMSKDGGIIGPANDVNPPVVTFDLVEDPVGSGNFFVIVDVTDDAGLTNITAIVRDDRKPPSSPPPIFANLIFDPTRSNNYTPAGNVTPGALSARLAYRIQNVTRNASLYIKASDQCGTTCPDNVAPNVITVPGGVNLAKVKFLDNVGIEALETFNVTGLTEVSRIFVQGAKYAEILFQIDDMDNLFGALVADQCNAYVFDPVLGGMKIAATQQSLTARTLETPVEFALDQNYPNPFNPATQINFALPESGDIHLTVYDVLGRVVRVLASGSYDAGRHVVAFDASTLASGTYFYQLRTPTHVQVRQMILMK